MEPDGVGHIWIIARMDSIHERENQENGNPKSG
jgi:hypothetical protein